MRDSVSFSNAAIATGISIVIMTIAAIVSINFAIGSLVAENNVSSTASNILNS